MKITYFVEIFSSWCHWAEPTWSQLQARYAGRANFEWKIALMNPADFPASREQCDWFYRRSGGTVMHSGYMLNSGWMEIDRKGHYEAPNLVAEAGRDFGIHDDTLRLALASAALRDGARIGDMALAAALGAKAVGVSEARLLERAKSDEVRQRVAASTAEFHSHQISQRPAFVLVDAIGDKAVFSGLVRMEPLAATIDAMLADSAAYAAHSSHHGKMPA